MPKSRFMPKRKARPAEWCLLRQIGIEQHGGRGRRQFDRSDPGRQQNGSPLGEWPAFRVTRTAYLPVDDRQQMAAVVTTDRRRSVNPPAIEDELVASDQSLDVRPVG